MKPAQLVVLLGGAGVPTAPTLSAPANAAVLDDTTPEFSWQAVPGAVTYDIEIRATLTGTPTATGIATNSYTPGVALLNVVLYSWRVRGVSANGVAGAWSATRTFTPVVYWLEDRFTTDDAAPIATPRTTEPGGQTLTIVDTNSKMSITGGKVVALSGGSSVYDPGFYGAVKTRVAGRALALTLNTGIANNTEYMGFAGSATLANTLWRLAFTTNSGLFAVDGGTTVSNLGWIEPDTWYTLALIVRTTGMYFLVKGGAFAGWRLLWVSNAGTGNALYPAYHHATTAVSGTGVDDLFGVDIADAVWTSANGVAYFTDDTTADSQEQATPANFIAEHTITAQTGVTQELSFHYTDDNNRYIVRCDQANSKIYLYRKVAGTETEIGATGGAAQTWTNGTQYRVVVVVDRREIRVGVGTTFKLSYLNPSGFGSGVNRIKVSHAGTNLIIYPAYPELALPGAALDKTFMPYGDSKTWGSSDNVGIGGRNGYPGYLVASITAATGQTWGECPARLARSGYTTAQMKALIDADLAEAVGTPNYILYNLGVNDVAVDPASYQADTEYILDAMHAKWPSAKVIMEIPGCRGQVSPLTVIAARLAAIAAARSSWCFIGADERVYLENGDDYATYTTDGIHPNHNGHVLKAAQWQTQILAHV